VSLKPEAKHVLDLLKVAEGGMRTTIREARRSQWTEAQKAYAQKRLSRIALLCAEALGVLKEDVAVVEFLKLVEDEILCMEGAVKRLDELGSVHDPVFYGGEEIDVRRLAELTDPRTKCTQVRIEYFADLGRRHGTVHSMIRDREELQRQSEGYYDEGYYGEGHYEKP